MIEVFDNKITYKIDNKEAGYILYSYTDNNTISIDKVFVHENMRGKGIGRKLLEYTYSYFNDKNIKIIYTCSYSAKWNQSLK